MTTRLTLCLTVPTALTLGLLIYHPLRADGPCFEVAQMPCRIGLQNAYSTVSPCRSCICRKDRACPCDVGVTNITLARVPTGRYCTQTRGVPCADDFDLARNADGSIRQTTCARIQACHEDCVPFLTNGHVTHFQCKQDRDAKERVVRCSHYVLTGKDCPNG